MAGKKPQRLKKNGKPSRQGKGGGRPKETPSKKVDLKTIERGKKEGLTDKQLAGILGLSERTIQYYKLDPKFLASYKKGKEHAVRKIEESLFVRAQGYLVDEMTIEGGKITKVVRKHIAADVTAQIFFLKNRAPANWKDRRELTGADGKDLIPTRDPHKELAELLDKNGITLAETSEPAGSPGGPGDGKKDRLAK